MEIVIEKNVVIPPRKCGPGVIGERTKKFMSAIVKMDVNDSFVSTFDKTDFNSLISASKKLGVKITYRTERSFEDGKKAVRVWRVK